MKSTTNKEQNYSIYSCENYKKELNYELGDITEKYSQLLIEYYKFITGNVKFKKNNFSKFIIMRGLDTITHVFNNLLLYTKNLELTYYHCQKSFYLYVEFVGQISEDEKMFLQLSSRDATTYVYKKTIFDLNSECKKAGEQMSDYTKLKFNIVDSYVDIYKIIVTKLIATDFTKIDLINKIESIFHKLNRVNDKTKINIFNKVIIMLFDNIIDIDKFYEITNIIAKKFSKNQNILNKCIDKIHSQETIEKCINDAEKFVSYLLDCK